jgi:hypothetical protein
MGQPPPAFEPAKIDGRANFRIARGHLSHDGW